MAGRFPAGRRARPAGARILVVRVRLPGAGSGGSRVEKRVAPSTAFSEVCRPAAMMPISITVIGDLFSFETDDQMKQVVTHLNGRPFLKLGCRIKAPEKGGVVVHFNRV